MFSASQTTVEQTVVNYLNEVGLAARGSARGNVPGTDQRNNIICASTVDLDEAYKVGQKAVHLAVEDGSGYMSTMIREPGEAYRIRYDKVSLEEVANSERVFPQAWLTADRTDVTDDFVRYAKPLIGEDWPSVPMVGGIQRFARLKPIYAQKKLPPYVLEGHRK